MQLDTESLRAFAAVLDLGGMTRAADSLGMTQSAVSWKIKRLEEKVGRDLLIREGRSFRPSRDGRELLSYARTIIATHDEAVARLQGSEASGVIRLGTTEEISLDQMSLTIARFNRLHPGATIELLVDVSSRLEGMIDAGQLDVGVLQVLPEHTRPTDIVLWQDSLVWVSTPDQLFDDVTVPLITFSDGGFYRSVAETSLKHADIEHTVAFAGPSIASVIGAVEAGLGVAILPETWVSGILEPWPRARNLDQLPVSCKVARSSPGEPSAVCAQFLSEISTELSQAQHRPQHPGRRPS